MLRERPARLRENRLPSLRVNPSCSPENDNTNRFPMANQDTTLSDTTDRPRIAVTLGDVAGIGPEVVIRSLTTPSVRARCRPTVIGHPQILSRTAQEIGTQIDIVEVDRIDEFERPAHELPCWNPADDAVLDVPIGQLDARSGRAAYDYLIAAGQAAIDGQADAITTAPLNKAALHRAGLEYPGHTEILAELCGVDQFAMMLYLPPGDRVKSENGLGVAHVTLHTSVASVPGMLTIAGIRETIELIDGFLRRVGCASPRIGVCALNPHAGEDGLFGDEERRIIAPSVERSCDDGINATGPLPADTLLLRAVTGEFDGVAAMYHDQGHIALKLIGFDTAVNVTLGLPIVRTSPSHGTAFDIAGQGVARADGMIGALGVASLLARSGGVNKVDGADIAEAQRGLASS